jgi:hypothetical protein
MFNHEANPVSGQWRSKSVECMTGNDAQFADQRGGNAIKSYSRLKRT